MNSVHYLVQYFLIYDDCLTIRRMVGCSFISKAYIFRSLLCYFDLCSKQLPALSSFLPRRQTLISSVTFYCCHSIQRFLSLTALTQNPNTLASGIFYNRSSASFIFVLYRRRVQALTLSLTFDGCDRLVQNLRRKRMSEMNG